MGLFGSSTVDFYTEANFKELQNVNASLLALRVMMLEKEKYIMGMTSAEDYKKWLNGIDKSTWDLLMKTTGGNTNG